MTFKVGARVCVHDEDNGGSWIGVVTQADFATGVYRIKQDHEACITSFVVMVSELHETLMTFEGWICVECWPFT